MRGLTESIIGAAMEVHHKFAAYKCRESSALIGISTDVETGRGVNRFTAFSDLPR
jgi:hypothetical protein